MIFKSTKQCRICMEDISRFDYSSAVRPCKCKGTQEFVHHKCLQKWLGNSSHTQCKVCSFNFEKYKRKDGCLKVTENMIKSRKLIQFIVGPLFHQTLIWGLLYIYINFWVFTVLQFYPGSSVFFCPTDYQNINLQLKNGTLNQDQLSFMCIYASDRFNYQYSQTVPFIKNLVGQYFPSFLSLLDISSFSRKYLPNEGLEDNKNKTIENYTTNDFEGDSCDYMQNLYNTFPQNSKLNFQNQSISQYFIFQDPVSYLNCNPKCYTQLNHQLNATTSNLQKQQNDRRQSHVCYLFVSYLLRPVLLLEILYLSKDFLKYFYTSWKEFLKYIDKNFRRKNLCFVEYKMAKRQQIIKQQRQINEEQKKL
eukprot:403334840